MKRKPTMTNSIAWERVGEGINNQSQLHTDGKMLAVTPKYNPTFIYINHNENKSGHIMEL